MKKMLACFIILSLLFSLSGCKDKKTPLEPSGEVVTGENEKSFTIYSLRDDTLCPILTDNDANRQMLGVVYEPLVRLNDGM
ncbi:MAG: hypothetical protein IKC07_01395, partial [Clostridia bacterium]|nr:hypothetical protein [Clostridia bacterium]